MGTDVYELEMAGTDESMAVGSWLDVRSGQPLVKTWIGHAAYLF